MLSEETETKIIKLLKTIAEGENSIEINRKLLSDSSDFDPQQIFINLAPKGKEYITPLDLVEYFNNKKIFISYTEAKLLVLFYDQNYDGNLTYTEFVPLVESKNSEKKTTTKSPVSEMPKSIEHYLLQLIQKEVEFIKDIIGQLYDLRIKKDFNCHSIYHALKNINKITEDSIGDFFEKKSVNFMNEDLIAIIKRLDINKDGIVDLCELHAFFGFPNCTFCCPCIKCPTCGISCCDECLPDIPCYMHKCVHHQNHAPLERKTLCHSDTNDFDEPIRNVYYSSLRKLNEDMPLINYDLNEKNCSNIRFNCVRQEVNNNNFNLRNEPINICRECNSNYKYSPPRKYYNNSNTEICSTLPSFSPSCLNCSQNTLFRERIPSCSNVNFSNIFSQRNGNYGDEQCNFCSMAIENEIEKGKMYKLSHNY